MVTVARCIYDGGGVCVLLAIIARQSTDTEMQANTVTRFLLSRCVVGQSAVTIYIRVNWFSLLARQVAVVCISLRIHKDLPVHRKKGRCIGL